MELDRVVGEHEFYCCGARVLVRRNMVKVLTEPRTASCPLAKQLCDVDEIDAEAVKRIVETKVKKFRSFCAERAFDSRPVVPYGASEIISSCMRSGLIDCAVTVCEGAGTVIAQNAQLVQEIGATLTGIIRTSPIGSVIQHIKSLKGTVLDEGSARIDQVSGVAMAMALGCQRIAVTVAGYDTAAIDGIRSLEKRGVEVVIFSVCNTCASKEDAVRISSGADVACASASRLIRKVVGGKALMQLGVTIPVFALTPLGKKLLLAYLETFEGKVVAFRSQKLPYLVVGRGPKLRR